MALLKELKIFIKHILYWIFSFIGFSFFFFLFGLEEVTIFGKNYFLPLPSENSFSVQVFNKIQYDLLPPGVRLVVTNPMSAFISQILLSMLLSFLLTTPFFIYKIITYLRPALLLHERKAVLWSLLPIVFLFFLGSMFSYFFLIPATFKILYPYATSIGAVPFFSIDEFIHYVFGLMFAVGLMFLFPIFMVLLSFTGIIRADFWRRNWRYALLFFLISSAIITPDGTGITMMMLFIPEAVLYFAGYVFANKFNRHTINEKVELVKLNSSTH
jgi:sec-independent protein translocase protein TatC